MTLLCSIEEILISWSQFKQFDAFRVLADHVSWFDTLLLVVILFFLLLSSKASLYKRMQYLVVESICGGVLLVTASSYRALLVFAWLYPLFAFSRSLN